MEKKIILDFIDSFFKVFGEKIKYYNIIEDEITGAVVSINEIDDEELQEFSLVIDNNEEQIFKSKLLCDYLIKHNLVRGDRVTVPESKLKTDLSELGWTQDEAEKNIDYLCSVEVKMIDDGEKADSFFIHF